MGLVHWCQVRGRSAGQSQLEDLSFQYIDPETYNWITTQVTEEQDKRERFINEAIAVLKKEFDRAGLVAEVSGRPKYIYSIHQKMERYAAMGRHSIFRGRLCA